MPDSWGVINLTFSAPGKPAYRQSVNFFRQLRGSRQWRSSLIRSIFKGLRDLRPLPSEKNSDRLSQTKHQCAAFGRTCLPPSPSRQLLIFLVFWALGARLRFGWRWGSLWEENRQNARRPLQCFRSRMWLPRSDGLPNWRSRATGRPQPGELA